MSEGNFEYDGSEDVTMPPSLHDLENLALRGGRIIPAFDAGLPEDKIPATDSSDEAFPDAALPEDNPPAAGLPDEDPPVLDSSGEDLLAAGLSDDDLPDLGLPEDSGLPESNPLAAGLPVEDIPATGLPAEDILSIRADSNRAEEKMPAKRSGAGFGVWLVVIGAVTLAAYLGQPLYMDNFKDYFTGFSAASSVGFESSDAEEREALFPEFEPAERAPVIAAQENVAEPTSSVAPPLVELSSSDSFAPEATGLAATETTTTGLVVPTATELTESEVAQTELADAPPAETAEPALTATATLAEAPATELLAPVETAIAGTEPTETALATKATLAEPIATEFVAPGETVSAEREITQTELLDPETVEIAPAETDPIDVAPAETEPAATTTLTEPPAQEQPAESSSAAIEEAAPPSAALPAQQPAVVGLPLARVPPANKTAFATREEVRWCVYESKRLDYLDAQRQFEALDNLYKARVTDYNQRCPNLNGATADWQAAQNEAATYAHLIRTEATEIESKWTLDVVVPLSRSIQLELIRLGYYADVPDGIFDATTVAAIDRVLAANDLPSTYVPTDEPTYDLLGYLKSQKPQAAQASARPQPRVQTTAAQPSSGFAGITSQQRRAIENACRAAKLQSEEMNDQCWSEELDRLSR